MRLFSVLLAFGATALAASDRASAFEPLVDEASARHLNAHSFALVIGVNHSNEPDQQPLRYADDDAVRYHEFLSTLGVHSVLLTTPDENTRRLHPATAAEARPARLAEFRAAVTRIAAKVRALRDSAVPTQVYLFYAGHGHRNETNARGFLTLEDHALDAEDLQRLLVSRIDATAFHFIVDACNAEFLTAARGPGGTRRKVPGFLTELAAGIRDPRVGILFATSSEAKTYEYEGFQAGVFSHLVRSGLHGAADFNLDGLIGYDEIQRFVTVATAAIPNEKYRPAVHALEPVATRSLLDIRSALLVRRIEVTPGVPSAHHTLEDGQGVRFFDFHNAENQRLHLILPAGRAPLSLSRVTTDGQEVEYEIGASDEPVVKLALLDARPRTVAARGAADNAFRKLFMLAFSPEAVAGIRIERRDYYTVLNELAEADRERAQARRRFWTRTAWGTAAAAALTTIGTGAAAGYVAWQDNPHDSQYMAAARNASIQSWRTASIISGGVALGAALVGTALQLWPDSGDRATLRSSDR